MSNIPISQCNWSTEGTDRNEPTLGIHPRNRQSETKVGQPHQCISNPKAAISNESIICKFSKHIPITPENSIIQSPSIIYPHHSYNPPPSFPYPPYPSYPPYIIHHFSRDFPYFPPDFPPFSHRAQQRTAPCGSAPAPRPWGRARRRWVRRCWCRPRGPWPRGNHGQTMGKHEMRTWKTVKKYEKYDEKIWWYQGGYMMVYEIYEIYLLKLDDMSHVEVGWLILFGRVRWIGCVRMAHRFLSSAIKPVKKN